MTEYLERGGADWNEIVRRFTTKQYIRATYTANAILDSEPEWKARYDRVRFRQSLRNLVATLYLHPPSAARLKKDGVLPNQSGIMPPGSEVTPSGEYLVSAAGKSWKTPSHQIHWVDASSNQNDRLTLYAQLLPGDMNSHYQIRVEERGCILTTTYQVSWLLLE
jgi:hypothetical protein